MTKQKPDVDGAVTDTGAEDRLTTIEIIRRYKGELEYYLWQ